MGSHVTEKSVLSLILKNLVDSILFEKKKVIAPLNELKYYTRHKITMK